MESTNSGVNPFFLAEQIGRDGQMTMRDKALLVACAINDEHLARKLSSKIRRHAKNWADTEQAARRQWKTTSALEMRAKRAQNRLMKLVAEIQAVHENQTTQAA